MLHNIDPLTQHEEAFFRTMMHALISIPKALGKDLEEQAGFSTSEYITLMHLSEAPNQMMRMSALASACDLSVSGMTRLVSKLENDGRVRRTQCASDARGYNAELTPTGLARLERAYPTHLASVRRHIMDHFQDADLVALESAFAKTAAAAL
jgi:DNA-binding MarR family transcriptional regulator